MMKVCSASGVGSCLPGTRNPSRWQTRSSRDQVRGICRSEGSMQQSRWKLRAGTERQQRTEGAVATRHGRRQRCHASRHTHMEDSVSHLRVVSHLAHRQPSRPRQLHSLRQPAARGRSASSEMPPCPVLHQLHSVPPHKGMAQPPYTASLVSNAATTSTRRRAYRASLMARSSADPWATSRSAPLLLPSLLGACWRLGGVVGAVPLRWCCAAGLPSTPARWDSWKGRSTCAGQQWRRDLAMLSLSRASSQSHAPVDPAPPLTSSVVPSSV